MARPNHESVVSCQICVQDVLKVYNMSKMKNKTKKEKDIHEYTRINRYLRNQDIFRLKLNYQDKFIYNAY